VVDRTDEVFGLAKSKLSTLAFIKKDLNRLATMLQKDERLITLAQGTMVGKEFVGQSSRLGVVAATNHRLLFCVAGQSTPCLEFPFGEISALTHTKKELEFDHDDRHVRVKGISPTERTLELVSAVRGELLPRSTPTSGPKPTPTALVKPPSRTKKVAWWAVAAIVGLIVIGGILGGDESKKNPTAAPEPASPAAVSPPPPSPEETPTPKRESKPVVVTSTCTDETGDIEDGNFNDDASPPPGMDLTKVSVKSTEDGITVTYESTTPAVMKTPPGVDRLYWNISYGPGNQLLAKLVKSNWEIAQFDVNSGQTNFSSTPEIRGRKMIVTYPVSLGDSFKWGSNTEYGDTNYQDFCPENFKTVKHG
jgi:hypothetical protein